MAYSARIRFQRPAESSVKRSGTLCAIGMMNPKSLLMSENKLLLIIVAVLLPPLAVALKDGVGKSLIINIILTLLFYVPGLIHALMVVL